MQYKCTDYSVDEDWTTGVNSVVFDYGTMTDFYIGWDILLYWSIDFILLIIWMFIHTDKS